MDILIKALLITHVSAGFTSLGLFFIPMFARKGSKLHNTVGRWYTYGMWGVVITAVLLCVLRFAQGEQVVALFLGFLALLTSRPLYFGIAILKNKEEMSDRMLRIDILLCGALTVFSPVLLVFGFGLFGLEGHPLLIVFGALGMVITLPDLRNRLRGPRPKDYNWLGDHLSAMLTTAIAAFTAFFAFGGRKIFGDISGNLEVAIWIAPTLIGVAAIRFYKRRIRSGHKVT
ncbi:hypothetical protein [Neolewinella agarilytica]|uniref:DUF2306 domain-containing protein n=1 Tax=Neolewinella agarilytica TaxID=478744 RepID=A0A1H9FTF9_9BACT|nr:hypothetical protein [Neolewinella agarilytica]SEQ41221.1 hypothetical protein SAMN05444359_10996 [Neolewinella agarilytica]